MKFKFNPIFLPNRDDYFEKVCLNKKALHVGACDAPYTVQKHLQGLLLHERLDKICSTIIGIDIDQQAVDIMKDLGYSNIVSLDMNEIHELDFCPDVIVIGETIEHLTNIEIALTNIKKIMTDKCQLLISTPNAFYLLNFFNALKMQENTHEDHKHYFSPQTLIQLLAANKLEVQEIIFTFLGRKTESFKKKIVKRIVKRFPMLAETLVLNCKLHIKD